ncbi:hypothetical protein B0H11DRAFT_1958633 [Mycena galericulata]|nr:hypothetical protein B0H11DRAFT_1958633 [Mycena galericulata]
MKIQVALTVLFLGSFVSANSGIFSGDGQVLPGPPSRRSVGTKSAMGDLIKRETNFERLRRGLPPLPPKRRSPTNKPGPRPSQQACAPLSRSSGYIALIKADGTAAGYISKALDSQNSYGLSASRSDALKVEFPSSSPFHGPINIRAMNGPDARHPYLGAVAGGGGFQFGQGQVGYAYLAGTGASPAHSPPSSNAGTSLQSLGYNGPSESQIWTVNCKTLGLSPQWTNTDSTQPPTTIFYDPIIDSLGLTSDLDAFSAEFPSEGAHSVTFTFVPL